MGLLGAAHGWEAKKVSLPKICHTYPTMMKFGTVIPYLNKILRIYKSRDTPLVFCWHQHLFTGNQKLLFYHEIQKIQITFQCIISIFLTFFESLKVVLINIIAISMMSAKLTALVLLKIKVFFNKGYDVIISDHYVTNKILSLDSHYTVDVVMTPKFGNSSISIREVTITSIL